MFFFSRNVYVTIRPGLFEGWVTLFIGYSE